MKILKRPVDTIFVLIITIACTLGFIAWCEMKFNHLNFRLDKIQKCIIGMEEMAWFKKEQKKLPQDINENTNQDLDQDIAIKLKASADLRSYINSLPFDKYEKETLLRIVDRELELISYCLQRKIGENHLNKIRERMIKEEK